MTLTTFNTRGASASVIMLALGLAVVADGCSKSSSKPLPVPAPQDSMNVVSFSPPRNFIDIPRTAFVSVTFDEDVNPATLTTANFVVADAGGQIPGTITYDVPTRTAVFAPSNLLPPSTPVTVFLSEGIRSTGSILLNSGSFTFTTGTSSDVTNPTFGGAVLATPENGANITISWAAASDDLDGSGAISYWIYRSTTTGTQNFSQPVRVSGPGSTSYTDFGLSPLTDYFYVVRAVDTSLNEETNTFEVTTTTLAPTSWSTDVYPLLSGAGPADCSTTGCHDSATSSGGLVLTPITTALAELRLISNADGGCSPLRRVEPGDSLDSQLYRKLAGIQDCGGPMPQTGGIFNNAQLQTVIDWIEEGALDN